MTVPRRWHARALLASAIAAIVALPPMPASADESGSPVPGRGKRRAEVRVFTVGITQDVDLDEPAFTGIAADSSEGNDMVILALADFRHGCLRRLGLAESWEESEDWSYSTYKIRPDLKWSDGEPLTARDAAYTFNRVINGAIEQTNYAATRPPSPGPRLRTTRHWSCT